MTDPLADITDKAAMRLTGLAEAIASLAKIGNVGIDSIECVSGYTPAEIEDAKEMLRRIGLPRKAKRKETRH